MNFNPSSDDRIESGDFLIAMGEPSQLRQLEKWLGAVVRRQSVISNHLKFHENCFRLGDARDRSLTSERFGVASLTLMENAGTAVAEFVTATYGSAKTQWDSFAARETMVVMGL